ncbi:uncharacterized protein LOC123550645 [Mercenaria mercenaria]|uniref:uncharacterized protein LOC123550645 n=1 Tax=Mercenaria mercenaria TaxID=6596 RepID=UPI00234F68D6|nr:uncharacterized protein LOC123550645 [Mercenaria mercenaria]
MRIHEGFSFIVIPCSILSCTRGQIKEEHVKNVRKTSYRLKQALVSVDDIIQQLGSLTNATVTCNIQLQSVTKNSNAVCKNIDQLGKSEVSLTRKGIIERVIRVDVKEEYYACVDRLRSHCSELYSEIWCLRVALWRNNHYSSARDILAEDILFGINANSEDHVGPKRAKRDTEQVDEIAPDDITIPPTGYRIRQEYPTLTVEQRQKYHVAVRKLYELSTLTSEAEVCNAQLENVTKNLHAVCEKITQLGTSEVNLTETNRDIERTIRVDVKDSYSTCADKPSASYSLLNSRIWCLRAALWRNNLYSQTREDQAEDALFGGNLDKTDGGGLTRAKRGTRRLRRIAPRDITTPRTGYRIRKEYRTLTVEERRKYHAAVRELYEDRTFNCFALVHRKGIRLTGVHRGEAFLPWHRAFLALYEEALRQIDPDVSLPYWDSTIDYNMATPVESVMWDEEHLGTGFGVVNDGPFANFTTNDNPLRRRIGNGNGRLMRPDNVEQLFQDGFCNLGHISRRLESLHNSVHRWVGGTMVGSLSASDPVFYMHHAFIDYIWEKYRERQKSEICGGIDPGTDYPIFDETFNRPTPPEHMPEEEMDGMEFLINRQGIENFWTTNWYGYEETPTCANNCGNSADMFCDEDLNMCVGETVDDLEDEPIFMPQRMSASIKEVASIRQSSNSICRTQPYYLSCRTQEPPSTIEGVASAMVNHEIPVPAKISRIEMKIQKNREKMYETPPESEPAFFRETIRNDCRTVDTVVYDILVAKLRGKRFGKRKTVPLPE